MADFRKQILEDFDDYRNHYPNITNLNKDEWALNFWVLDKLFSIDESVIETHIVDYNDKGIDCFVWHEDLHDLYLIQNKYYDDSTPLTVQYVMNDFLTRSIGALEKGTYTRSEELQGIYNKFHTEDDFSIHFYLYCTNTTARKKALVDAMARFNEQNAGKRYDTKLFTLNDIEELYYQEPITNQQQFTYTIQTINEGTILNVDNEAYRLTLALDAKYVLAPVTLIYNMYKTAKAMNYSLFEENIREYLGSTGPVNKKIVATLKDHTDRSNFFFYNNGITMIVSDMTSESTLTNPERRVFDVINPQIVNGCQTVSTIYETLAGLPESSLETEFSNTFVMIKILKIPQDNENLKLLYKNIVTYNNSQNSISEKTFNATRAEFKRTQDEFRNRGFLVCIKQSDKNKFTTQEFKVPTKLLDRCKEKLDLFGLENYTKTKDFLIDLEKLLQVILAFVSTPQDAIQNKSKLLKDMTPQNVMAVSFIKNTQYTYNDKFDLCLLYLRAEQEKQKGDGKIPNPFYLIYFFSRYEVSQGHSISQYLNSKDKVNDIIRKYKYLFTRYYDQWTAKNTGKEYNDMIKSAVDYELLDACKHDIDQLLSMVQS